jgi:SAM-dependent methyltransferase
VSAPFRCLACTGGEGGLLHAGCPDLYLGRPFVVDFWKCAACGLVQQHPLPEDTSAFYEASPVHARKSRLYSALRWAVMGPMYCALGGLPPGAVVVDYGCGDGGFLDAQRGRGFELVGFEPDAGQAERLSRELGLSVFGALDPLLAAHAGRADVVTLHMVLEHLTDPDQALSAVARLLKPGGTVYAVVPHLGTTWIRPGTSSSRSRPPSSGWPPGTASASRVTPPCRSRTGSRPASRWRADASASRCSPSPCPRAWWSRGCSPRAAAPTG